MYLGSNILRLKYLMELVCKHCNKFSSLKFNFALENPSLGISLIIVGVLFLIIKEDLLDSRALLISYSLFLIFWGIINIARYYNKRQKCPNCQSQNTLLEINTPEAQEIIKENNLSVPE